jgi:F5/8 type C domain
LNFGLPEQESLTHHERMSGYWKEISRGQASLLKSGAPFLPRRRAEITLDPVWYAHQYIDAAMEISEGWFEDPLHHYLEIGGLRGYLPTRPIQEEVPPDLTLPNLALNKPATQSSLSQWSKGTTVEEDAGYAVSGDPSRDGFHTNSDPNPWWMVDLGSTAQVHFIRIFNRERIPDWIQQRANPLVVELSDDGEKWDTLFRTNRGQVFGGYSGGRPLLWSTKHPVEARFVRISIPRQEYLHLAEVEIYGRSADERTQLTENGEPHQDFACAQLAGPLGRLAQEGNDCGSGAVSSQLKTDRSTPFSRGKAVTRVLFFVGVGWAFGSVHFELVNICIRVG